MFRSVKTYLGALRIDFAIMERITGGLDLDLRADGERGDVLHDVAHGVHPGRTRRERRRRAPAVVVRRLVTGRLVVAARWRWRRHKIGRSRHQSVLGMQRHVRYLPHKRLDPNKHDSFSVVGQYIEKVNKN
jgi:hypothetical protein